MARKERMSASVFWAPVGWTVLVVSVVMWLFAGFASDERIKNRDTINSNRDFQQSLFRNVAGIGGEKAVDPVVASIAAYLREQSDNLDEIVERERLISSSLNKEQRTMLYVQSPERFPKPLLWMTNELRWRALRDDAVALSTLKKLLSGEMSVVPEVQYDTRPAIKSGFFLWWSLTCQMLSFLVYLWRNWAETMKASYTKYHWYDVGIPTRVCMVLLLPGAAPMLVPMVLWAIGRRIKEQWSDATVRGASSQNRHFSDADSRRNGTDFLKKLQKRVERRTEGRDVRVLPK